MRLASLILVAALSGSPLAGPVPVELHYDDGLLTVHLVQVPLDHVVELLEEETGLEMRGELRDQRQVTKRFEAVPLPEALDRLLGRQNFVLRFDADGRPAAVDLYGLSAPRFVEKREPKPVANVLSLFAGAPPVALSPVLRQALGAGVARPSRLFVAAVHQRDPAVRIEAGRAFLAAVEGNPALRQALRQADPRSIVRLIRSSPWTHVDQLLTDLGRRSGDPLLRGLFVRTQQELDRERAAQAAAPRG
jgi:hypothetical protein